MKTLILAISLLVFGSSVKAERIERTDRKPPVTKRTPPSPDEVADSACFSLHPAGYLAGHCNEKVIITARALAHDLLQLTHPNLPDSIRNSCQLVSSIHEIHLSCLFDTTSNRWLIEKNLVGKDDEWGTDSRILNIKNYSKYSPFRNRYFFQSDLAIRTAFALAGINMREKRLEHDGSRNSNVPLEITIYGE